MLQLNNIKKEYVTGDLRQTALNDVSLSFRDNEFVAILGPSGSGKTTLLNIVGGLDRYDSGDLIINGISTKKYKDRDWDSYRNHTIGFVFQSYNLIPHQNILSNVELALTISGVSRSERKKRAEEALEKVGLKEHMHKRPNQLSGGQMQRVAIARALVNDPDILLADEPTGALDSDTGIQVMDMLKEVAKDRLVIMVTHNPELAESYANRIVKLYDGKITSDSNPFTPGSSEASEPQHKNMGKTSMSFLTSLSLSFNNLRTKKGRTILTAFAGSIGIIGIALILSLSNGVNTYINDIQRDAMSSYPITIDSQSIDLSALVDMSNENDEKAGKHEKDAVYANNSSLQSFSTFTSSITTNNLTKFKKYLEEPDCELKKYVGKNGIIYSYSTKFGAYSYDPDGVIVNLDGTDLNSELSSAFGMSSEGASGGGMSVFSAMSSEMNKNNLTELIPNPDGNGVSDAIKENYELIYGKYPESYDEIIMVLTKQNELPLTLFYELGMLPSKEYKDMIKKIGNGEKIEFDEKKWSYEDICKVPVYIVPACDYYTKGENGTFKKIQDKNELSKLTDNAIKLKITGIIRPVEDSKTNLISMPLGYTKALTDYLISYADNSEAVKAQRENKDINILSGVSFAPKNDDEKIADVKNFCKTLPVSEKAKTLKGYMTGVPEDKIPDETVLAQQFDKYIESADKNTLLGIYDMYISPGSYEENMKNFGVVSREAPSSISIYADTFEAKDRISECIERYNEKAEENDKITYTDYVGLLMSSITTIINVISYVLIAFVAVSLVVSSIMIGIITYISVLERTKEIGILRAIGASKKNISRVFNAETFIIGLCSGVIGIGVTLLLLLPANAIIHVIAESSDVNAILPVGGAVILIILSIVLTLIGGFIPSKKAAKQDPVKALRTE